MALLIAVGAFRVWNANANAAETEVPEQAAAVEPSQEEVVEDQLPPYMLPDPESPESVPDPPRLTGRAGGR